MPPSWAAAGKSGIILANDLSLKDSYLPMYEGAEISCQILAIDDVLLCIRWWDQGRWTYSDVREIIVKSTDNIKVHSRCGLSIVPHGLPRMTRYLPTLSITAS